MVSILLADSHCHLDWFEKPGEKVAKARENGVSLMLSNATGPENLEANMGLAEAFPEVRCALGIHPVNLVKLSAEEAEKAFSAVERNLGKAVAVGEVGMDFKHASSGERRVQEAFFRRFIGLAIDNNLAVCVHARYAETQCLDILEEMDAKKVHMHWFTNSGKTSGRAVELGYKISCGPVILHDGHSASIVREIPLENLLLETDAPVSFKGEQSEPSWIPRVCERLAELKGVAPKSVGDATTKNFLRLFRG